VECWRADTQHRALTAGATSLTVMPEEARRVARLRPMPWRPAFEAALGKEVLVVERSNEQGQGVDLLVTTIYPTSNCGDGGDQHDTAPALLAHMRHSTYPVESRISITGHQHNRLTIPIRLNAISLPPASPVPPLLISSPTSRSKTQVVTYLDKAKNSLSD